MIEQTIKVERMEDVISVFGSFDQNLRLIEAEYNVRVTDRDACLHITGEAENVLLEAVRALPEQYAAPLYLHYYAGYSLKEIGRLLGLPAATVGTRLSRGRAKLKTILQED